MSTLVTGTIKSNTANPPLFQNTSGTEIGTLCRAWVNFNGTGTVAIRASYNVSSITDNGTGDYTVNFATAMVDANYSAVAVRGSFPGETTGGASCNTYLTGSVRILTYGGDDALTERDANSVAVFR
jgi:hypothetical protein